MGVSDPKQEQIAISKRVFELSKMKKSELADLILGLESELSKYKSAAVLGGDGEPIKVGDTVWRRSRLTYDAYDFVVRSIKQLKNISIVQEERSGSAHNASDCYSSPDAVPEGSEG